jgi:hypothetical protein
LGDLGLQLANPATSASQANQGMSIVSSTWRSSSSRGISSSRQADLIDLTDFTSPEFLLCGSAAAFTHRLSRNEVSTLPRPNFSSITAPDSDLFGPGLPAPDPWTNGSISSFSISAAKPPHHHQVHYAYQHHPLHRLHLESLSSWIRPASPSATAAKRPPKLKLPGISKRAPGNQLPSSLSNLILSDHQRQCFSNPPRSSSPPLPVVKREDMSTTVSQPASVTPPQSATLAAPQSLSLARQHSKEDLESAAVLNLLNSGHDPAGQRETSAPASTPAPAATAAAAPTTATASAEDTNGNTSAVAAAAAADKLAQVQEYHSLADAHAFATPQHNSHHQQQHAAALGSLSAPARSTQSLASGQICR